MSERPPFDEAPETGSINFSPGQPSADLIPLEQLGAAAASWFKVAEPLELNYGEKPGDVRFRHSVADFLTRATGLTTDPEGLFLSGGNSQGLNLVCQQFSRPGDTVLVEDPGFFLAYGVFRDHGLNMVPVPMDGEGFDMGALETAIKRHRPRLVYTVPDYQNPTGQVMAASKRALLAEMSRDYGFTVIADEVYQLLHYGAPPPPHLGSFADRGDIISLGSFSKILAPGARLGWIQTHDSAIETLVDCGTIRSGGNVNHFASHLVRHLMDSGDLMNWLQHLRSVYSNRLETMDQALQSAFGDQAQWITPEGGYFFWVSLNNGRDTKQFQKAAFHAGTGYIPGCRFSVDGGYGNDLRLSFAHYPEAAIEEGIQRLAGVLRN